MDKISTQIWKIVCQSLVAFAFLFLLWGIAYLSIGNELVLPSLSESLLEMGKLFMKASFWQALLNTCLRSLYAFLISLIFGGIFAVIAYMVPTFQHIFTPIISVFRTLPILAVLLILLCFLGAGEAPIAVACLSLFPILYTGVLAGLSSVDENLNKVARLEGASLFTRIVKIYLPLSSPYILREAGGALAFSLKLILSAEVLAQTAKSLGGMMQEAKIYGELPTLFALVLITFLIGFCVEILSCLCVELLQKKIK